MALWDKSGKRPTHLTTAQKRNVIATSKGWVRRNVYTDVHSNVRFKDEPLVAIGDLANEVTMGNPDILEVYVANTSGGTDLKAGGINYAYVVFSEPLSIGTGGGAYTLNVANTASGNSGVVATSNTNKASITNANNTLVFQIASAAAGTYKIEAQSLANTAAALVYSVNGGSSETVNTAISAAVSNALGTFTIS